MIEPAALLAAYTDALNRYDLDAVEHMFAEDAVYASPGLAHEMRGRKAIMSAFRNYFAEHTDQINEDLDIQVLDSKTVECRWTLRSLKSQRSGVQRVVFNATDQIARIDVSDDP